MYDRTAVRPCSRPAVPPSGRTAVRPYSRMAVRPYSRTVLQLHSCLAVSPDAFDRPMICDCIFFGRGLHFFWARLAFFFGRGLHFSSEVRPIRSLFSEAHNPCRALKSTHKGEVRSGSTFPAKKGFTFQKCIVRRTTNARSLFIESLDRFRWGGEGQDNFWAKPKSLATRFIM